MIKDLKDGLKADGLYLVKAVNKCLSTNGGSYLNITLQDKSGFVDGKKWSVLEEDSEIFKVGNIVRITADANMYKDKIQLKIYEARQVSQDEVDLSNLIIESPIPLSELDAQLKAYVNSIQNEDCKKIVIAVFKKYYSKFVEYPAAVQNHHEFYHGLIYHTVSMCRVAEALCKIYPTVDYDILISGCLLHDCGKVIEFSGPVATKYTLEGNLLGHISMGAQFIKDAANEESIDSEIPLLLEHMVLAHHGKYEFGSPVLPKTKEALLLSMIDDMDSKLMSLEKALNVVEEGEFTEKIYSFDNRTFYKPKK